MELIEAALSVASIINFVALLLLLRAILKDRKMLRGYSITGSFLTFVSLCTFEIAYYLLGNWISVILGFAGILFWALAFVYSLRLKIEQRQRKKQVRQDWA